MDALAHAHASAHEHPLAQCNADLDRYAYAPADPAAHYAHLPYTNALCHAHAVPHPTHTDALRASTDAHRDSGAAADAAIAQPHSHSGDGGALRHWHGYANEPGHARRDAPCHPHS